MIIQVRDLVTRKITHLFGEYSSLIWTERFQSKGDFELIAPLSKRAAEIFDGKKFIKVSDSDNLMIVSSIEYGEEDEIKIKGYDLKGILYGRVIYEWRDTEKKVKLKEFMTELFNKSLVSSDYKERNIDNISLSFEIADEIADTTFVTDINRGDTLGEAFENICKEFNLGIKGVFDVYSEKITFIVYSATDRKNIVFSRNNHNFKRSNYVKSYDEFVSSMLVGGEGEGNDRKMVTVSRVIKEPTENGEETKTVYDGIRRIESFLDARDIQINSGETDNNYKDRLKSRAIAEMNERNVSHAIDGEIRDNKNKKIGVDYNLGDIVTVKDEYFKTAVRITELIRSWSSSNGYEIYPTFEALKLESEEVTEEFNIS